LGHEKNPFRKEPAGQGSITRGKLKIIHRREGFALEKSLVKIGLLEEH